MICRPRDGSPPKAGWRGLSEELDLWAEEGWEATLWWRDDDATVPTPQLHRLLAIAGEAPVALAVIPFAADPALAAIIRRPRLALLQHGWRHSNHAGAGGRKSEFPEDRAAADTTADLARGRARLAALFGEFALAVLAPPWNRFAGRFLPLLRECGIRGLSRAQPRRADEPSAGAAAGVVEADIHLDITAWRADRGFIGESAALSLLVDHLRARRIGLRDRHEPTGLLTHHLVLDEASEDFLRRLLALTLIHPAARWLEAREIFERRPCPA